MTLRDCSTGAVTVNVAEPLLPACVAAIVALPTVKPWAKPVLFTVATAALLDCQVAVLVRSAVLPSE